MSEEQAAQASTETTEGSLLEQILSETKIIELGPGAGALTDKLVDTYGFENLQCIEIDPRAIELLNEKYPQLHVVHEDVLQTNYPNLAATAKEEEQRLPRTFLAREKSLVLLVNEGTASSAEVFASALRDNGRTSTIVGTKTFGKG